MRKHKNILYVGGFELPDKNAAAHRVINNSKIFSSLNYSIYFNGINKSIINDELDFTEFNADNYVFYSKAIRYPDSVIKWFYYITSISKVKKIIEDDLKENVSYVIAYNYPALKLWRLKKYCSKRGIKIIADVTEWYQPEGAFFLKAIKIIDSIARMRFVHYKMDGLIVISNYLLNYYKRKKCIKLPPLVDKNAIKWRNNILNSENKIITLNYVGSPGAGKKDRLDLIIGSLSQIKEEAPGFVFQIIGISESEYNMSFPKQPIPENIKDQVSFLGRMEHADAIEKLKSTDFSIFLRNNNLVNTAGFPTKFVESINLGIPVLTNNTSDLADYLINGKSGFILDISTPERLNNTLRNAILTDSELIFEMKKYCESNFSFHYQEYRDKTNEFLNIV